MASPIPTGPSGRVVNIGIPESEDIPRLVYCAPYFTQVPLAELIEPSVVEAVNNVLPALVPPYVDAAAQAAVQAQAVLLVGSTMTGPLFLSPLMPTQPSQAATMAYVDSMIATAGIPEVPPVPSGQVWARETGQWVPITPQTGVFLPLSGGSMVGNINMSGNTIQNMAAVPAMPNGAAPAQWVLNQIASVSLYQGTWDADTNVPDLTQLSTHVNAYTWIALTTAPAGVVIGAAIPGLQGTTVFNGDTIIYSTVQGGFKAIHAGGITLPEADGRFVQLAGSQMSGALLLNANASQPLQAVTLQQLQAFVPPGVVPEAPNDGQLYGRNGLTASWAPVLPLAGGILTGALTLAGNATANLNPVPLQQMNTAISAATAPLLPLAGGTMTGPLTLSGNATVALNPVPLQQLNAMLSTYAPIQNPTFTGTVTIPAGASIGTVAGNFGATGSITAGVNLVATGAIIQGTAPPIANAISCVNLDATSLIQAGTTISAGTNIAAGGFIQANGSRILSVGNANNPSVVAFDSGASGAAVAMWSQASELWLGFANNLGQPTQGVMHLNTGSNMTMVGHGFQPGGGPWFDSSDNRIKTVTGGYTKSLAAIMQLQPKQWTFNGNDTMMAPAEGESAPYPTSGHYQAAEAGTVFAGLVADEIATIFPECVTEQAGFIDGASVSDLKILNTGPLLYAIINAITELGQRVEALDGKTAA